MKINFIVTVWGSKYIESFNNNFLTSFCNDKTFLGFDEFLSKESSLIIYTLKKDSDLFNKEKISKLKVNLNVDIKYLDNIFSIIESDKYELLSKLQNIIINLNYDCDYLSFIYPDFIFSKESIYNCLKLLKKNNYSAIFSPVPRLIEEQSKNVEKIINTGINLHIKDNIHPFDKTSFTHRLRHNPSIVTFVHDDYWIYKNFHSHPIFLKNLNNQNYFSNFSPSIDEDFIKHYVNTNYYVAKDSNEMLFASMTKIDEMRINEAKFDSFTFSQWALEHIREIHKDIFINHNYILYFNNKISSNELKNGINEMEKFCNRNFFFYYLEKKIILQYYNEYRKNIDFNFIKKTPRATTVQKLAYELRFKSFLNYKEKKFKLLKDVI